MNYSKIIKAINEGLNKALMSFDNEQAFDKNSNHGSKTAAFIVYIEESKQKMESFNKESYQWFLNQYLTNGFQYTVIGKVKLQSIINMVINVAGNDCNLNWIDTSQITDMSWLFEYSNFNGDISNWDVSNVEYMFSMFECSSFNGDISNWDVSKVIDMGHMFDGSAFNDNISNWNVSKVKDMKFMFVNSALENNPPVWYKKWKSNY